MSKNKASLIVSYDGEALKDNSIDIQELALALTGLGELFQEANKITNGEEVKTEVKIKGFQPGSFEIITELYQYSQGFLNSFNHPQLTGALNLLSILGFSGGVIGVIQLFKKLKNEDIKNIEQNNDKIIIEINSEKIEINRPVYELYTSSAARKAIQRTLQPLEKEGYDKFSIKNEKKEIIEEITKSDLPCYFVEAQEKKILEAVNTVYLNLVNISFKEGNKWRFFDGEKEFFATILDSDFLYKVQNNLTYFSKNDTIKVELKIIQYNTEEGLKIEYKVLKVLEHKSAIQLKLDIYKKND